MTTTETDDAVIRSLDGNQDGYEELYRRHGAMALRAARGILGDPYLAEEARQEAFLQAFRTLHRKQPRVAFSSWLYRCVVWAARTQHARRRRPPLPNAADLGSTSELDRTEMRLQLVAAMQELPIELREVLVLRFYLDLAVEQVARILGCRAGTVKSRCSRALARLKESGHLAGLAPPVKTFGEHCDVRSEV